MLEEDRRTGGQGVLGGAWRCRTKIAKSFIGFVKDIPDLLHHVWEILRVWCPPPRVRKLEFLVLCNGVCVCVCVYVCAYVCVFRGRCQELSLLLLEQWVAKD